MGARVGDQHKLSGFSRQVKAARLSFPDIVWLSGGVITEADLKRHSSGTKMLSVDDYALVLTIIERHREAGKGIQLLVLQKRVAGVKA